MRSRLSRKWAVFASHVPQLTSLCYLYRHVDASKRAEYSCQARQVAFCVTSSCFDWLMLAKLDGQAIQDGRVQEELEQGRHSIDETNFSAYSQDSFVNEIDLC